MNDWSRNIESSNTLKWKNMGALYKWEKGMLVYTRLVKLTRKQVR